MTKRPPPPKVVRPESVEFPDIPYEEIEEEDVNKVVEQVYFVYFI